MTDVYILDRGGADLPESASALLPVWRRERLEKLRAAPARQDSLAAGLLWRYAMERRGLSPDEAVTRLAEGKPVLSGREDVFFSLSHSGRYAMCAVSGCPVGADVQQVRPIRLSVARRFHPGEQDWLLQQPEEERTDAFFRLWTRKEAWVKEESDARFLSLAERDVIHPQPGLRFCDYTLPGGFLAAVCVRGEETLPAEVSMVSRETVLSLPLYEFQEDTK